MDYADIRLKDYFNECLDGTYLIGVDKLMKTMQTAGSTSIKFSVDGGLKKLE